MKSDGTVAWRGGTWSVDVNREQNWVSRFDAIVIRLIILKLWQSVIKSFSTTGTTIGYSPPLALKKGHFQENCISKSGLEMLWLAPLYHLKIWAGAIPSEPGLDFLQDVGLRSVLQQLTNCSGFLKEKANDELWEINCETTMQKRIGFGCENANDYHTESYQLCLQPALWSPSR